MLVQNNPSHCMLDTLKRSYVLVHTVWSLSLSAQARCLAWRVDDCLLSSPLFTPLRTRAATTCLILSNCAFRHVPTLLRNPSSHHSIHVIFTIFSLSSVLITNHHYHCQRLSLCLTLSIDIIRYE